MGTRALGKPALLQSHRQIAQGSPLGAVEPASLPCPSGAGVERKRVGFSVPASRTGPPHNRCRAIPKGADEGGDFQEHRPLCEVRAGQYWRVENLKSFDEFLERRFPESRRKAYYL